MGVWLLVHVAMRQGKGGKHGTTRVLSTCPSEIGRFFWADLRGLVWTATAAAWQGLWFVSDVSIVVAVGRSLTIGRLHI